MSMGDVEKLNEPLRSKVKAVLAADAVGRAGVAPGICLSRRLVRVIDPVVAAALPSPSAGRTVARRGIPGPKKQTATERAYNVERLRCMGVFEGITVKLPGGSRYTADFYVPAGFGTSAGPELHEAKGWRRLGSQGRAHTAFREAAAARPEFRFVWAERQKGGGWRVMFDSWNQKEGKRDEH